MSVIRARRLAPSICLLAITACATATKPTTSAPSPSAQPPRGSVPLGPSAASSQEFDRFELQRLFKRFTDLSFMTQLGSEMIVRKIIYGGAGKLPIPAYFFAPRDTTRKRAAMIFVHGGIHGNLDDVYVRHIRSLVREGYIVVAPEYRGSTGYGKAHYDAIDYGGKEVEDVIEAATFLRDMVPYADLRRIGIIGWSHGGFISLHAVIRRPELFRAAVAHVPVADLPARIRTHSASYEKLFADQPGYGGTLAERPQAYVERSPIAHARKLTVPVLVHAASNDTDVFIIENHNLRDSMIAAGKDRAGLFRYREWADPPGGHDFSRVDTREAAESWNETIVFLRKFLGSSRR